MLNSSSQEKSNDNFISFKYCIFVPYPVPSLETNSGNTVSIVAAWVDDNDRVLIFSSFATASRWLSELVATRAIGVIAEEIAEDTFFI